MGSTYPLHRWIGLRDNSALMARCAWQRVGSVASVIGWLRPGLVASDWLAASWLCWWRRNQIRMLDPQSPRLAKQAATTLTQQASLSKLPSQGLHSQLPARTKPKEAMGMTAWALSGAFSFRVARRGQVRTVRSAKVLRPLNLGCTDASIDRSMAPTANP